MKFGKSKAAEAYDLVDWPASDCGGHYFWSYILVFKSGITGIWSGKVKELTNFRVHKAYEPICCLFL